MDFGTNLKKITYVSDDCVELICCHENGINEIVVYLNAYGDCCSNSYFVFNSFCNDGKSLEYFIGNQIVDITEIDQTPDLYKSFGYDVNDLENNYQTKINFFKFLFRDKSEYIFILVNESNGYYSGWMEINKFTKIINVNENNTQIMIIIGLPGSGKSTFSIKQRELYGKNIEVTIYTDTLDRLYCIDFLKSITNTDKKLLIIDDPRLCDKNAFIRLMNHFEKYVSQKNISVILFENNVNQCKINIENRENGRMKASYLVSLEQYAQIYNTECEEYSEYNPLLLPVYSCEKQSIIKLNDNNDSKIAVFLSGIAFGTTIAFLCSQLTF